MFSRCRPQAISTSMLIRETARRREKKLKISGNVKNNAAESNNDDTNSKRLEISAQEDKKHKITKGESGIKITQVCQRYEIAPEEVEEDGHQKYKKLLHA